MSLISYISLFLYNPLGKDTERINWKTIFVFWNKDKQKMTHESLQLAAEFSSIFLILLVVVLDCSSFSQSQLA